MPDNKKPLFSQPVLAIIMLFCTLAIWALHSTAPNSELPTPIIEKWKTTSNIPVIWLKQEDWKNGDKLEVRFSFKSNGAPNPALTQATFAMLMSDSLPLSTTPINQRLASLATKVSSHYDHETQTIGLTLSNQPQYLTPSLSLITHWLAQPHFKQRTFNGWLRQQARTPSEQHDLESILLSVPNSKQETSDITLQQVVNYYRNLQLAADTIFIVGDMSDESKQTLKTALNSISQNYQRSPSITELKQQVPTSSMIKEAKGRDLWQTKSAMVLTPLSSIKEWISLQIWGADLVSTLNQQQNIDFVQLALTLSQHRPWVWWNIQYRNHIIEATQDSMPKTALDATSFTSLDKIPSTKEKDAFEDLYNSFTKQLEQQVQSPTWWSYIATQVTHENSQLTIEEFANGYKEAVDTFTIDDYKAALKHLFKPSSYQEIQVYQ